MHSGATTALAIALASLVFALYWPALKFGFLYYDDPLYITNNSIIQNGLTWDGFRYAFTNMSGFWQPLTWLVLMLEVEIFGIAPHGFHFVNVLLHACNVLLLFRIACRISAKPWPSAFVSAIFACHPLTVESVAWVSEIKGLLAGFMGLLSTLCYLKYLARRSVGSYALVGTTYLLGLMAKPSILPLPLLFILVDYAQVKGLILPYKSGEHIHPNIRETWPVGLAAKLPFVLIGMTFFFVTCVAEERFGALRSLSEVSFAGRVQAAITCVWLYVVKVFYPANLSVFYPSQQVMPLGLLTLAVGFLLGLIALAVHFRRRFPPLALGLIGFAITLLPHVGLIRVGEHVMADRYMYLPLIFILGMAVAAVQRISGPQNAITVARLLPVVLVLGLTVNSRAYLLLWASDRSLFQHALQVAPNRNFVAHNILGLCQLDSKNLDEAATHFTKASQIAPDSAIAHHNLALVHQMAGRVTEAEAAYRRAVALSPDASGTLANFADFLFANALSERKRTTEALKHSARALVLCPNDPKKYDLLASILFRMGNTNGAHKILAMARRQNVPQPADKL